jgi:hypothetical protein
MDIKKLGSVVLQDTATSVVAIGVEHFHRLGLEISNQNGAGDHTLNKFEVWAKTHLDGDDFKVASVSADFTTPKFPVLWASSDLTTLAKNSQGFLLLDVTTFRQVTIKAAGNGGTSTLSVYGIAKHEVPTV